MHDLQERRELPLRIVKASKDLVNGSERIDTLGPAPLPGTQCNTAPSRCANEGRMGVISLSGAKPCWLRNRQQGDAAGGFVLENEQMCILNQDDRGPGEWIGRRRLHPKSIDSAPL